MGVKCSTSQCELRSTFPNNNINLRVTNVIRIVTYYTLHPLESPDSSWMTRSQRSRRRDKGLEIPRLIGMQCLVHGLEDVQCLVRGLEEVQCLVHGLEDVYCLVHGLAEVQCLVHILEEVQCLFHGLAEVQCLVHILQDV